MPLGGVTAKFLAQLRYGDDVVVESGIEEFRRSSFDVRHRIVKDGTLCVEALETRIWIGYDAKRRDEVASRSPKNSGRCFSRPSFYSRLVLRISPQRRSSVIRPRR